jgi:hypothetical protein
MNERFNRITENKINKRILGGRENGGMGGFTTLLEFGGLIPFTNTHGKRR